MNFFVKNFNIPTVHFCNMALHKGKILEQAVRITEYPISLLAKKMGKSRRHIYDLFEKENISLDIILKIGLIINYDFSKDFKELINLPDDYKFTILSEPDSGNNLLTYWRSKYLDLLEKHQLLLEEKLKEYFDASRN